MKTLILFWYGSTSSELEKLARRAGFQFNEVILVDSHWMTPPPNLDCVKTENFRPVQDASYVVITNGAEHNQLVPVIAKLEACQAEFEVYEFFYGELRKFWP